MNLSADFSLFWLVPIAFFALFLAIWYYRGKSGWINEIARKWRFTLITLRALSLFLIGVLLLGLIIQAKNYRTEKPVLIVGIDTSLSMTNYKDSNKVRSQIEELIANSKERLSEKFDIDYFEIGSSLNEFSTVKFYQNRTDLSSSLEEIRAAYYNRNIGGVLMVTDGNFNYGSSPIYIAEKMPLVPVYTIGVGDTIAKRDQFIKHIAANDVAFINNDFPVVVDVEGSKMGRTSSIVSLEENGQVIAKETVHFTDGTADFQQLNFVLSAKSPGFHQYKVRIERKENEYNYENNVRTFYIEVIDSRSKILILSNAPHPDISAMKAVWETDANLEVKFEMLDSWDKDLKNVDLIVWHEPGNTVNSEIKNLIVNSTISKLYVIGSSSNASNVKSLGINLTIPNSNQLDDVEGAFNNGFQQFEVSEELKKAFNFFPPLKSKFGRISAGANIDILSYQRIGPVVKKEPQIFFGKVNSNSKYGVIYGEGIWKWRLIEYAKMQSHVAFNELISKVGQLLMVKQNTEPFRVTLPKKFSKDEDVTVNATVLNASLEPITTSVVQFILKSESGKESKMQFGVIGSSYQLNAGKLSPGKYEWSATTSIAGKSYKKSGVFVVEDRNIESLDTRANHNLLRQLAANSKGMFNELKNSQKSLDDLLNRTDLTTMSYEESSFNDLIDYLWILITLFLLLGLEWFLRRWLGSY